jgi:hypothetical protein
MEKLNRLFESLGAAAIGAGKEALTRALHGAAEGALSVGEEKLEDVSSLVEEGKRRVKKARSRVRSRTRTA